MTTATNRIALLTSSRADYSIYRPLIDLLDKDERVELDIIAFGSHNSELTGNTAQRITEDGYAIVHNVDSLILGDGPEALADAMGLTMIKFSKIWSSEQYRLIICLGDRYEMYAAVSASVPFNIPVAHISGGETTEGAIDNVFRHALTLMSTLHFTSTDVYKEKVVSLLDTPDHVHNVGALSIDNLSKLQLYSIDDFKEKFNLDLNLPSVLITIHPETVSFEKNEIYIDEVIDALEQLPELQLIITMPNLDTKGSMIRQKLLDFINRQDNAFGVESFGTLGYLSCMKYCRMMLGNTSSGFVEASYFPKAVINLGDRQKGRLMTPNIVSIPFESRTILEEVKKVLQQGSLDRIDMYGDGNAAEKIHQHIINYLF